MIATEAVRGLKVVSGGEAETITGWLIYGAALNEGRKLFPKDELFGQWIGDRQLGGPHDHDRSAAMWAAENTDLMYERDC